RVWAATGMSVSVFLGLFATLIFFDGLVQVHDPPWHRVFRSAAILAAAAILAPCWAGVFGELIAVLLIAIAPLVMLLMALSAAIIDVRDREYRDLWHWLGVVALFGAVAHLAILAFILRFR